MYNSLFGNIANIYEKMLDGFPAKPFFLHRKNVEYIFKVPWSDRTTVQGCSGREKETVLARERKFASLSQRGKDSKKFFCWPVALFLGHKLEVSVLISGRFFSVAKKTMLLSKNNWHVSAETFGSYNTD